MENSLKIKITIANRVYPLTIKPSQEENIRKAAKKIESLIKNLEESYAVRDKQDVLAMCSLQYASKIENMIDSKDEINNEKKINHLLQMINDHMSLY